MPGRDGLRSVAVRGESSVSHRIYGCQRSRLPGPVRPTYERLPMSSRPGLRLVVVALTFLVLGAGTAAAQKGKGAAKPASACGQKLLPLTVGNTWTYEPIPLPPEAMPREDQIRFLPPQFKKVVVTVASIETKDGKSVVHLTEDSDGRKVDTTIVCGGGVFEVDPESIFFAGEPGGSFGTKLTKIERKQVEGVGLGAPWSNLWREDIIASFERTGSETVTSKGHKVDVGKGKLEIERRISLGGAETVDVPFKAGMSGRRMTVEFTGRVTLDGTTKPVEHPANWNNALWFVDGVGLAMIQNAFFHKYGLVSATIVK
jgi:hypothetical protein